MGCGRLEIRVDSFALITHTRFSESFTIFCRCFGSSSLLPFSLLGVLVAFLTLFSIVWFTGADHSDEVNPIKARLQGSQKGKLAAQKPTDDAPKVDLHVGSIKMAPPQYKKGDKKHPDQFFECFIAEQNLVGVAVGAQCRDRTIPFTSCDQIRNAAVSFANLKCAGSHVGVSTGEDGPSQMALEDLALFRTLPGSTVLFYPTDAVAAERATELAANIKGIVFIRTGRPALPVLYDNNKPLAVGQAKVLKESPNNKILLIGAGVTIYEIMKAADHLEKEGMHCCVIDPFTIKPLDEATIVKHAQRTGGTVLTVEDHYPAGGIGEAVAACVAKHGIRVKSLCINDVPRSGKPDELLDMFGISTRHIAEAVKY
ncbi:unnamed protein product [Cylicocyclus nassatus]|uniref:transketolase n=1 Tax=Cylicocyclus nassatus TaxID=53992 RepID=A0AA36H8W4_CYLNA|nr:unnamed protein product [Cylicocyclus nassatus]